MSGTVYQISLLNSELFSQVGAMSSCRGYLQDDWNVLSPLSQIMKHQDCSLKIADIITPADEVHPLKLWLQNLEANVKYSLTVIPNAYRMGSSTAKNRFGTFNMHNNFMSKAGRL